MNKRAKYVQSILRTNVLPIALLAALAGGPASAIDVNWQGGVDLDYATGANWPPTGVVPDWTFDEVAVIANGNAVFLNTSLNLSHQKPAGLRVGPGSLEIQSLGALEVLQGSGNAEFPPPVGDVTVSGTLTLLGSGSLTAVGAASLTGNTRLVGPDATFSAGNFSMGGGHALTAEITSSSSHSALSTVGAAALDGVLALEFNGITTAVGNSWTLIDAGSVAGSFTSTTATALPLGQAAVVGTSAGGNGQLVSATIVNQLVLSINTATGATSIDNLSTADTEDIDGYSITAASNTLNPAGWTRLGAADANWEEANPAPNHIGELNFNGSRVVNTEESISLGTAYVPPSEFGLDPVPVQFEYNLATGETREGAVVLTPNTLVLQVDPSSGQSQIVNPTGFDVNVDGYSVTSASGSLDPAAWTPLADSDADWEEANPANNHVGELNFTGSRLLTQLEADAPTALGNLFNSAGTQDLTFEFNVPGGAGFSGDFTGDGNVLGDDFLEWQKGNAPGGATAANLQLWETDYGATGGSGGGVAAATYAGLVEYVSLGGSSSVAASAVPEPASCALACALMLGALGISRRGR
ncbi:hypothetical protein OAS39_11380 [Pirellulales bacterium]|nr:hypothetical protein [Pirellulales bacterium]